MIYQLIKVIHVSSVITFIGGLLMLSLSISTTNLVVHRTVRRWDRRITLPALLLVWISGLTLAMQGHWFGHTWLTAKLCVVAGLSAFHGVLAGTSRLCEREHLTTVSVYLRKSAPITIGAVIAITTLVIVKPF
jgi:uncharacterized membrane protein